MDKDVVELCPEPRIGFVATARNSTLATLARHGLGSDSLDDAELMVSELVTNALQHGAYPIGVMAWSRAFDCAVVEVHDAGPVLPEFPAPDAPLDMDELDEAGRGLPLVACLSRGACGVEALEPHGKAVWFGVGITQEDSLTELAIRVGARIHARRVFGFPGWLRGPSLL